MPDHVHLLVLLSRTISQSELAEKLKSNSSRWFKTIDPRVSDFCWQGGYGIFGIDATTFDRHRQYIINQKKIPLGLKERAALSGLQILCEVSQASGRSYRASFCLG